LVLCAGVLLSAPAWADRFDELSGAMSDPSWRVRLQAVVVMAKLGDARATPVLVRALGDNNETVRGVAAQALGELGGPTATAALHRAKQDASEFVRDKVTAALEKLQSSGKTASGSGGALHVEIGGIGAKAHNVPPELKAALRRLIEAQLARTPGLTLEGKPLSGFLIDSAITALSRKTVENYVEISCEVSMIVGRLPSKAMVMMTSGGATVQVSRGDIRPAQEASLERDALEGAVRGAHENLLSFLKTQHPN
jgi:hypothetical protein